MVIKEANPQLEMRRVVVPFIQQTEQEGQATTQPLNLLLVPVAPKRTMVKRIQTTTVADALERTLTLVTKAQAAIVPNSKATPISTPMPNLAFVIVS